MCLMAYEGEKLRRRNSAAGMLRVHGPGAVEHEGASIGILTHPLPRPIRKIDTNIPQVDSCGDGHGPGALSEIVSGHLQRCLHWSRHFENLSVEYGACLFSDRGFRN